MRWKTASRPQRYDELRGKPRVSSVPDSHGCSGQSRFSEPISNGGILGVLCPTTLKNPRARRRFFPERWQPSGRRRMVADAWLFVPEGHRRILAGGQPAPAGAAPGGRAARIMPQRGIGEFFGVGRPAASPPAHVTSDRSGRQRSDRIPGHFYDAPLGHGATRHGFRGRRPQARTCPRLISSGVPPGREPGRRALPKGNPPARDLPFQLVWLRLRRSVFIALQWSIGSASTVK